MSRSISIRDGKLIYHLTGIENIENIIREGLLSRSSLLSRNQIFENVADPEIIRFRREHGLNDYVPFHFFSRNPFDGKVQKMYKEKEFVYLCMYRNKARDMRFEIIPRHPLNMNPFKMYNYEEGMEIIDWDTMDLREYSNYECKEICMAECVHKVDLGIDNFSGIYVRTNEAKCYVEDILHEYGVTSVSVFLSPNYFVNH